MEWKGGVIFYALLLLIIKEIVALIVWFIKRNDKALDDVAFKITKEKQDKWRYGNDFQFLPYFFMIKSLLKSHGRKNSFHYMEWLAEKANKIDKLILDYETEKKKYNEAYDTLDNLKDSIREAYAKLGEIEKQEVESSKKERSLLNLIADDIQFKISRKDYKKIKAKADIVDKVSDVMGKKKWQEFQEEQHKKEEFMKSTDPKK